MKSLAKKLKKAKENKKGFTLAYPNSFCSVASSYI